MKRPLAHIVVVLVLAGVAVPVIAADDGDAESGAAIASRECSACHRLPDGSGTVFGPDFETLARENEFSPASLEEALGKSPHPGVVQVEPDQFDDLAAWLNGLAAAR